jgi:hypothetical protein
MVDEQQCWLIKFKWFDISSTKPWIVDIPHRKPASLLESLASDKTQGSPGWMELPLLAKRLGMPLVYVCRVGSHLKGRDENVWP